MPADVPTYSMPTMSIFTNVHGKHHTHLFNTFIEMPVTDIPLIFINHSAKWAQDTLSETLNHVGIQWRADVHQSNLTF